MSIGPTRYAQTINLSPNKTSSRQLVGLGLKGIINRFQAVNVELEKMRHFGVNLLIFHTLWTFPVVDIVL